VNKGTRFSVDPYVKFYDKAKNLHSIKTRYYWVGNTNVTNLSQSSNSSVLYGDYQFQHKWEKNIALTAGVTGIRTDVMSNLFGDHFSTNYAIYGQYEHSIKNLDLTAGMRLEYYEQDRIKGDSYYYFNSDSTSKLPVYPIFRFGAHYQVAKATHLRASFGQGIRYPSVAERYTTTSVGALNVFANPDLRPETGWAAEIGIKQGIKIGKTWKALIDLSGFVNQYNNMMEFTFGIFDPRTSTRLDPGAPDYNNTVLEIINAGYSVNQMFGFAALNAESARIAGAELSFNSQGTIGEVQLTSLIGYTYMLPVTKNTDSSYLSTFSTFDPDTKSYDPMLKYRFNHLAKADVEAQWKSISIGWSARYSSFMNNIDKIFQEDLNGTVILPGIKEYREEFNKGNLVFDMRIGYNFMEHYRIGFIVNNMLNTEYSSRPGDVQAPRNFIVQIQMKF
jgi:iron complex outermembrane receptor protein